MFFKKSDDCLVTCYGNAYYDFTFPGSNEKSFFTPPLESANGGGEAVYLVYEYKSGFSGRPAGVFRPVKAGAGSR